ncbi:GNAT family N-acetyltransferase [Nonomuraea sp. NPDC059194]|uniref:GNAT family N-acetyltransferase n=1 Tax=Nonomuraea sp. NPDC059194 TaxID=3346764 RepID=UPI0036A510F1
MTMLTEVRPEELGRVELERWRAWQRATPALANPFLSPEFTLAVSRHRGSAMVAVMEDAFLPFERAGGGVGRAIGLGVSDCQGAVHAPGARISPDAILSGTGLAVWEFDHLVADQASAHRDVRPVGSPALDLSAGYQAYLDARRPSSRKLVASTERKARKLAREVGEVRLDYDCRDPKLLQALMDWKSAQYRRTGGDDRFAWPWLRGLVEESFGTGDDSYRCLLSVLHAGDVPIAAHFGPRSGGVLSWWFPAYDTAYAAYSPGLILLLRLAEAAAADGIATLDLGRGDNPYKASFASHEIPLAEGWVTRASARASLYRLRHVPPRAVRAFIVGNPALRQTARRAKKLLARVR